MIDPTSERLIPLKEVADFIPSIRGKGKRLNISTAWRWCLEGVRGRKLDSIVVGGSRYTSVEGIGRFVAALNDGGDHDDQPTPAARMRTPRQRAAAHAAAEKRLDAAGIR